MMMNTRYRSEAPETMDDFNMEGEILKDALDKIADINRLLGGNRVTLAGLDQLLAGTEDRPVRILDAGCGNGDMLRAISRYGKKKGWNLALSGIDANPYTLNYAKELSAEYPEIRYECADIFDALKQAVEYDVILCTLTLHHFKDPALLALIKLFIARTRIGIVVNDLHRSAIAYRLFSAICFFFRLNRMSREDGLISILRGFKKQDLESYSSALKLNKVQIRWCWAFRYQWIIRKENTTYDGKNKNS